MKYLKYFESLFNSPVPIDITIENEYYEQVGSVEGVIHCSKEYLDNWMYKEGIALHIDENSIQFPIAILKNINIDEEYRNQGYGNEGMREFLDAVYEAKNVFLMVDIGESNDFSLIEWYKSFGFEEVGRAGDYPVMMMNNEGINESSYTATDEYEFEEDTVGYQSGQHDMVMCMYSKNKELLAKIDYTIYNGEVSIKFIKSFIKGKGYGEELMKHFCKKYKYEDIDFGGLSEAGAKLKRKLDKFYNYDHEKYMDSKNKHLSKDIIKNIKNISIREFLENLINLGYKEAWEIMVKSPDYIKLRDEYDLNNIAEISFWIKGSLSNDNYPNYEPPRHILKLLSILIK